MLKIEFDPNNKALAANLGAALLAYGGGAVEAPAPTPEPAPAPEVTADAAADDDGVTYTGDESSTVGRDGEPDTTEETDPGDSVAVDTKGVPFDPDFCGKAADPYYGSGKRAGQWKKRRGVTDNEYDVWYAEQLWALGGGEEAPAETGGDFNAGAAFGGNTAAAETETTPAEDFVPADGGALIGWTSEQQAAGNLTDEDVSFAWAQTGTKEVGDFFTSDEEANKRKVGAIFHLLKARLAK